MYRHPEIDRDKLSPRQALDILIEGNQRFKNNVQREHDMLSVRDVIKEKQHDKFIRDNNDLVTTVDIKLTEAQKGFEKEITGINDKQLKYKVPAMKESAALHRRLFQLQFVMVFQL